MKKRYPSCRWLLPLVFLLGLCAPIWAITSPPTGRPLAEALNPDGTLKPGATGSFDARQFRMGTAPDGRPTFRPTGTAGAGDERWQAGFGFPNGVNGSVSAVALSGTDMYIGGSFWVAGNVVASHVAKWNGTAWSPLGSGLTDGLNGNPAYVDALAVAGNGEVYAGGNFTRAGGVAVNNVAKWNGTAWSALGTGVTIGALGNAAYVSALAVAGNGDVYAGGNFTRAGGAVANGVAKWNGTAWSSLGTGAANGTNSEGVATLALAGNGDVYVGGTFTQAGGVAANGIAKWNGTVWSSLGAGLTNGSSGYGYVLALAVAGNGDVYAAGDFTRAGGAVANGVAKWNGATWSSLGTGAANGVSNYSKIYALALATNGDVYVSGDFTLAGATAANGVAKWNGTVWSNLGAGASNGMNTHLITEMTVASNGDLYAGGYFTQAGSVSANGIAKWNGTAWSNLNTGVANGMDS